MARPRINKNWLFLGLAAALGVGAVVLSNSLLKHRMQELDAEAHRGQQTVKVIVASHDLARGQSITSRDVAVRAVPKEWLHSTALKPADFDAIQNQRLAEPLKRGETLLQSHLEGKGTAVFSANLKKGWRALTFEVDSVNSISGMLRPGDRIDLIYTGKPVHHANTGIDTDEDNVTLPLLSDVTVLATGQTVTKQDAKGQPHDFSTITLEVSPTDADRVIVAKDGGHLTALLRHPEDEARNDTRLMNKSSLVVAGAGSGAAAKAGAFVEYIVGGSGGGLATTTTIADLAAGAGNAH